MIVVMEPSATEEDIQGVEEKVQSVGFQPHPDHGEHQTVIGVVGDGEREILLNSLGAFPGVEQVIEITKPYKLSGKEFKSEPTVVDIDGVKVGGDNFTFMAGPCSVESKEQLFEAAEAAKAGGAEMLRGGAFKPRTSPYSFQGLKEKGLKYLAEAREKTGLKIVTEVMDPREVELVAEYADVLQIGARNMQNYPLLREVGKTDTPVLLKRAMTGTYREFLLAAEYVMAGGNYDVMLCIRGIRTFVQETRYTLDLSALPVLRELTHLPIIVDPSHSTGSWKYVPSISKGALATGADGLLIEIHPDPQNALSDGPQSLKPNKFKQMVEEMEPIAEAVGKNL
jgi:3-deoxy-7-phosphoheptulonate synthase